jgi:hypothetical protein
LISFRRSRGIRSNIYAMKTLSLSCLLLFSGLAALGQGPSELFDKAPPPIDEALRARVAKFYQAYMDGKFRDAYLLVADDSQDAFLQADKDKYQGCQTVKIAYSDIFTKATVIESCKGYWKWHGQNTLTTFPLTTTWKIEKEQWCWYYVKPKFVPSPFSPTGFVPVPDDVDQKNVSILPSDLNTAAQGILAKVKVDKQIVHLRSDESSQDVVHIRNEMPGSITLSLEPVSVPGLKVTLGKTQLQANEETTVVFDYRLDSPEIACVDCAKKIAGTPTALLHVSPTGQHFPLKIIFGQVQQPQTQPPAKP